MPVKPNIIVVDDEALIRDVLVDFLSRNGYKTFIASNGEQGLDIIRKEDIQFALVDVKMEGMNGIELTKQIKKHKPSVNVIIITGYPSLETAVNALKSGASEYIIKPFKLEEIDKIIRAKMYENDVSYENMKLKSRIKELESRLDDRADLPEKALEENKNYNSGLFEVKARTENQSRSDMSTASQKYSDNTLNTQTLRLREKLRKLDQLLAEGILTEKEYKQKKNEFLKG